MGVNRQWRAGARREPGFAKLSVFPGHPKLRVLPDSLIAPGTSATVPLHLVCESQLAAWLAAQPVHVSAWVRANGFQAERHRVLALPGPAGDVAGAVAGLGSLARPSDLRLWQAAALPDRLPPVAWHLATPLEPVAATQFVLGWITGQYRLARYRAAPPADRPRLLPPEAADLDYAATAAAAGAFARDLINLPANDLGPAELAEAAVALGSRFGAATRVTIGADLLAAGYPLVHAVGAGSPREPRLVDLRWGDERAPRVTLVGKGVCFDSGGLDIKPSSAMLLMKKDMGGAACTLALAQMLMAMRAPVRLRVLVPAVENSVDGHAYRPGDVLRSRRGLTVEIGNTDAEGRLVLADALAEADSERPDLLVDLATLTGAARTALGPELPAAFSPDDGLLAQLRAYGEAEADPVWPLPLWAGYDDELSSRIADVSNVSASPFAGAIIGALFLRRFVPSTPAWAHLDLYAWNPRERPGRPVGAEAQCVRALYRLIRARCG